jgi:hypothetical protein
MSQAPQPQQSAQPPQPRKRRRKVPWYRKAEVMVPLIITTLLAVFAIIFNFPKIQHVMSLDNPSTPIAVISPTPTINSPDPLQQAKKERLTLNDPLTAPKNWTDIHATEGDVGDCTFSNGVYLATAPKPGFKVTCPSQSTTFSDFAFQIDIEILQGDCGGIFFRATPTSGMFYYFHVCRNGTYTFFRYDKLYVEPQQLVSNTYSTAINKGDKTNTIAVVAQEDRLYLYVNGQQVAHVNDPLYSNGQIGVVAADDAGASEPTKVVFSNAKVWIP